MKKPLITVIIANIAMTCTATAPVYSLSQGQINHQGLGVILGSMTMMNAIAGGGLSLFDVPEGKYFKWLAPVFFVLSFVFFLGKF
jgi:hypothetical protein